MFFHETSTDWRGLNSISPLLNSRNFLAPGKLDKAGAHMDAYRAPGPMLPIRSADTPAVTAEIVITDERYCTPIRLRATHTTSTGSALALPADGFASPARDSNRLSGSRCSSPRLHC
jgi:hypothetical protein